MNSTVDMPVQYYAPSHQTQRNELYLINDALNVACSSAKIQKLSINLHEKNVNLRPQLHIYLNAPYGHLKSTTLKQIQTTYGGIILTDVTYPGLVGTIDKATKQFISSACWDARNSVLMLDEFVISEKGRQGRDITKALLHLLEHGEFSRKFGIYSSPYRKRSLGCQIIAKEGLLKVKTRFTCIIASMISLKKARSYKYFAFLSRCVPFHYSLTLDELDRGTFYRYNPYSVTKKVVIEEPDYKRIRRFVRDHVETPNVYLRCIDDCCRVFAVKGLHDDALYKAIVRNKAEFSLLGFDLL